MSVKRLASIPLHAIDSRRARGAPSLARLPIALSTFSYPPAFPFSLSVYGALAAPLVQHNALISDARFLQDESAGSRKRSRAQEEHAKLTEALTAKHWKKHVIADIAPKSTASTRYFRILGQYQGAARTSNFDEFEAEPPAAGEDGGKPWLYAVLDTDAGRDEALGLKFLTEPEGWLLAESGRWVHEKNTSVLKDQGEGEGHPATGMSFFRATQFVQTILEDLAPLQRNISLECSQLYADAIERIAARMRLRPRITRREAFARFVLLPDTPQAHYLREDVDTARKAAEESFEKREITPLYKSDMENLGLDRPEVYYLKGLMLAAALRRISPTGGRGLLDAFVLVNSDLSLSAPRVGSTLDFPSVARTLITHASRLLSSALTRTPDPSLAHVHSLLSVLNPSQLPLHARVAVTDERSKKVFRELGWKEVLGGMVEMNLGEWEWRDAEEWKEEQWFRRTKGLLDKPGVEEADGDGGEEGGEGGEKEKKAKRKADRSHEELQRRAAAAFEFGGPSGGKE